MKKKVTKNKYTTLLPNLYGLGEQLKKSFSSESMGNALEAGIGAIGATIGKVGGNLISGGKSSAVGDAVGNITGTLGSAISSVNPLLGGIVSVGGGIIGGGINSLIGAKFNEERINQAKDEINAVKNFQSDAGSFDALQLNISNATSIASFNKSDLGSDGLLSNKVAKLYDDLKAQLEFAENWQASSILNNAENLKENLMNTLLLNYAADGGAIHIAPSKRGTFTAAAKKHGKGVLEFARQVLANKDNYSPAMIKKANFARNAAKWHDFGGTLSTQGTDFTNGITYINNGNSHELNPYGGVLMGVDNLGVPNLVEEGEVIYNDYVFSNRLTVPKAIRQKYKLRGNKDMTFADAAKKASKESEERPNDPISKAGLDAIMGTLASAQEDIRMKKQAQKAKNEFNKLSPEELMGIMGAILQLQVLRANGGPIGNKYPWGGFQDINFNPISTTLTPTLTKEDFAKVGMDYETPIEKAVTESDKISTSKLKNSNSKYATWLRYAPVLGSALGLALSALSKPDYSNADAMIEAARNVGNYLAVTPEYIGNYLPYIPLDTDYLVNKLLANAAASRRAIANLAGGNRASAMAGILASDYNTINGIGDTYIKAADSNYNRLKEAETFNRATNQYNAEANLKALMANLEARMKSASTSLSGLMQGYGLRQLINDARGKAISANMSNLFNSLGNIGIDEYNRRDRDLLVKTGAFGTLTPEMKKAYGIKEANGGKINRKKRKGGMTY